MGLSQLEICNHALLKLGADTIDTLTAPTSTEDGTKRSIDLCNLFFDQAYDEILRIYPWNSATKRTKLTFIEAEETPSVIYEGGVTLTYDSVVNGKASWEYDDTANSILYNMKWNGTRWVYTITDSSAAPVITVYENTEDTTLPPFTGWTNLGLSTSIEISYYTGFGYTYYSRKPNDMNRLINCYRYDDMRDDTTQWVLEGDYILSDYDELYVRYVYKPLVDNLEPLCTNALICNLALKLAPALQLDDDWAARINEEIYRGILPQARSIDTFENKELFLEESSWITHREFDYPVGGSNLI